MGRKSLFVLLAAAMLAVIPQIIHAGWIKTYGAGGEYGRSVRQTTDGGYIITGYTWVSGAGLYDIWLLKTDANGDTLWTKTYGGEGRERANCVQQTSDGEYIIVGITESFATAGSQDLWLLKTDSEGDTLWTRIYGVDGGEFDADYGSFVLETPDGGYIVVGTKMCIAEEYASYVWLLKTDASGDTLWTHTYHSEARWGWNWSSCVGQTSDGGYILTGSSSLPNEGCQGLSLIKTDTNGDTMWTRMYGGEESPACGRCVQQTPEGGYVIVGAWGIPEPPNHWVKFDFWLLKTDENRDTLWTPTYDWEDSDHAKCLDQTSDGGYIIVGWKGGASPGTPYYMWLAKTDEAGDTLWTRTFGEYSSSGECVHQTPDGGYIITGHMDNDLCLIKTDSLGYVSAVEEPVVDATANWHILSAIGRSIVLQYKDLPQGFHVQVFDATGRKVDEIESPAQNGVLRWGENHSPGVYFIVLTDKEVSVQKVILIK
ncbi:hypothetical protein CEE36_10200 [candidate division TA06 bacterium B3_TA06]|uniref:Secretion system C-terminal sorting domain-containing protein n=1 Tax=candidate division TA06 bacterium B3_TA06 TaxID=2012487 RepID=A0A532UYB2_UNCT6|nr:MAG: hypothetical protein CEE36_10200 [candidate division TA06 bacterium B3_TA06]